MGQVFIQAFCGDAVSGHSGAETVGVVGTAEGLAVGGHTADGIGVGGAGLAAGVLIGGAADGGRQQRPAGRAVHLAVDVVGLGVGRALPRQLDAAGNALGAGQLYVVRRGGGRRHLGGDAGGGHLSRHTTEQIFLIR